MTQKDKELLLKDLCARLPYGVKISVQSWDEREMQYIDKVDVLYSVNGDEYIKSTNEDYDFSLEDIKPYLFPMSSIAEEHKKEFDRQTFEIMFGEFICKKNDEMEYGKLMAFDLDFYNKHHLDWRGLIPRGLAKDATGLNIY